MVQMQICKFMEINLHISIYCFKFVIAKFDDVNRVFSFVHHFFWFFLIGFTSYRI